MKTRRYLHGFEAEMRRAMCVKARKETEEQRLARLERAFKRRHPRLEIDRSILKLVGSEPYNPPSKDKQVNRRIIAERYG
jgi:hypothetical protein